MENNFKNLIISLLRRGKLPLQKCEKLYEENSKEFEIAFTHRTYDPLYNYEFYEILGDSVVNSCVMRYLIEWDKKIVSVKYLTRLKHDITSNKKLSYIAHKEGFFPFMKFGDGDLKNKKNRGLEHYNTIIKTDEELNKNPLKDEIYRSWLEDCFESFIGLVAIIIDKDSKHKGISFVICYNIISSFLDHLNISLKYEDLFDAVTRYKELCDKRWKFELKDEQDKSIGKCLITKSWKDKNEKWVHKSIVIGFPFGDKTPTVSNKKILAIVEDKNKSDSQNKACEQALDILKNKFNIYDPNPDPYKKYN